MAADFKVARPVEFYRQFLKEDVRPDGRCLDEFRKTLLNQGAVSTAEGSALVKIGNTMVVCGIKAEIAEPTLEEPEKGYLVTNLELPALCSSKYRPGPPSEQAQVLSQFIYNCCQSSCMISPSDLCIIKGKLCWVLYADLVCLNYDGNVADAALIAVTAALRNTYLPEVAMDTQLQTPKIIEGRQIPVKVNATPICTTYAVMDNQYLLVDPTDEEESLATGALHVVVTEKGQLCSVVKPGGTPFEDSWLQQCISRALVRAEEVKALLAAVKTAPER